VVAGLHTGCIQMFARPGIDKITDLRGKMIAVNSKVVVTAGDKAIPDLFYGFLVSLFTHVGMQASDVNFVEIGADKDLVSYFVDGKADAVLAVHVQGPILQANPKSPGRVILDTSMDKPWSQNYCCLLNTNRDWANAHPIALKRATRAILRGVDAGKLDVRAAARSAAERDTFKDSPGYTEQVIYECIRYESFDWRDYDPEETLRFFALRLRDAKLIKKSPQQVIDEGSDFAYFRQLRKELKA
jgi:NitT/TauT family transport system substrate-binding protein